MKPNPATAPLLRAAADLLRDHWTQGAFARRADGSKCSSFSTDAATFCALGAIYAAANRQLGSYTGGPSARDAQEALADCISAADPDFADAGLTHEDVVSTWNDHPARSATQVADMLTTCADAQEPAQ